MKRNSLYTANKGNKPLFALDIDMSLQNPYDGFFGSSSNLNLNNNGVNLATMNNGMNTSLGSNLIQPLSLPSIQKPVNWSNPLERAEALYNIKQLGDTFQTTANKHNPLYNPKKTKKELSDDLKFGLGAAADLASTVKLGSNSKRGLYDDLDPLYHLAGGRESEVGNAISDAGVGVFKAGVKRGSLGLMLAGGIAKGAGSLYNGLAGIKEDKDRVSAINEGINSLNSYHSSASSFDEIIDPTAVVDNTNGTYKGGLFSNGKARRKEAELTNNMITAQNRAYADRDNNIENITDDQMDILNSSWVGAYGGSLGNPTIYNTVFSAIPYAYKYALGGDIQTNGSDFTNGLAHIDAGGSHEENPYDGVQVGISKENGMPNLVEEGETIFDDYVFSKRIKADAETKKKLHLGKKANLTFADISKKLEKESLERPNDPISQASLKRQMHLLAEQQERQKQEEQQRELETAIASLSPEQQAKVLQEIAAQQQAQVEQPQEVQQETNPQQQPPEQQMVQQPVMQQPQEQYSSDSQEQQQQMQQQGEQYPSEEYAYGGKINRYDEGGDLTTSQKIQQAIYNALGLHTDREFNKWATDNKVNPITNWESFTMDEPFLKALSKSSPVLADVLNRGYNWGTYKPKFKNLTFDFKHGGWGLEDYSAWDGSTDEAWLEAVKKGLVKKGDKSAQIAEAIKQTDAYKSGTEWLKADEANRLAYLQAIYNSPDAPQAARNYAGKYVNADGWLKDAKRDYQTIFEGPNGMGVRNTHPGTYWKTPTEILRKKNVTNYVVNDDGTIDTIVGAVPKDWSNVGTYNWQTDEADETANYFKRASLASTEEEKKKEAKELPQYAPVLKSELPRYVGLLGPGVGLAMQMAGIGKPDFRGIDSLVNAYRNQATEQAKWKPIGNYLGYKPVDIWNEWNRMEASNRAADRAITNSASPVGLKNASLLANNYNGQIAKANAYLNDIKYNDARKEAVATFNKDTDKYNASAATQNSITNAELRSKNRQFGFNAALSAAGQKLDSRANWYKGIYGNVQGIFNGLSALGKENAQHNMIAKMAADNLFGTMSDRQNIANGHIIKKVNAKGGKLKRKRGLTF